MAKPNYRQARRAVDEAKKKKQEEKRKRKLERKNSSETGDPDLADAEAAVAERESPADPAPDA